MGEDAKKETCELSFPGDPSMEQAYSSDPAMVGELLMNDEPNERVAEHTIVDYLKEENQAMRQENQAAKRQSMALKSTLEQVIVAAQQDIEKGEHDRSALENDYEMLKLRLEEISRSHRSLERENQKLKSQVVSAKAETEALHHEFKQLNRDHETQQAKWSFDRAELEASKKHAKALEQEVQGGLRTITEKFTRSSTTPSLDYRHGLDALRKEKEMAELEIEKVLDRNKNQATLLQRLEKRLNQVKSASDAQIEQLQKQLNEERRKNARMTRNGKQQMHGVGSPSGSSAAPPQTTPPRPPTRIPNLPDAMEPSATELSRASSTSKTDKLKSANQKYTSLRDLLQEETQKQKQVLSKPEQERSDSERNLTDALAERNAWKQTNTLDGSNATDDIDTMGTPKVKASGTSQASFLEAAIQRNQKIGFWDKMFGGGGGDQTDGRIGSPRRISATEFLTDEIKEVVLENQRLEAQREKRLKEREEKARAQARANLVKVKTGVKWGLFNMFSPEDSDIGGNSDHNSVQKVERRPLGAEEAVLNSPKRNSNVEGESKERVPVSGQQKKNVKVEMTMDDVDDIDLDTLRRLAAERTKDLSEDQLNKILEKRRSSLIAMQEKGYRPSRNMSLLSEFSFDEEWWEDEEGDDEE